MTSFIFLCPKCKREHDEGGFCEECHKRLVKGCSNCREEVKECTCN